MSRRHQALTREILPDPKFGSVKLAKFINVVMTRGKRSLAERVVYGALEQASSRRSLDPIQMLESALERVQPAVEVKSRRVGGATYQVPVEVRSARQMALAMRWIVDAARKRSEKSMTERLAGELLEAVDGRGSAVKKREDVHRMAEANKAFSHYRW
ncbi:MAG: 30S ribosomal protein S7 [Gammaproteobacteria bacterium]